MNIRSVSLLSSTLLAIALAISTKIPDIVLGPVAAADPLWPPNLGTGTAVAVIGPFPQAVSSHALIMPANAGKSIDDLILGKK